MTYIRKILSGSTAVVLLFSLLVQSGYVSIEKVVCGSCEVKVSIGQLNSCCSDMVASSKQGCTIEQKCCKNEKSAHQFHRIDQGNFKLKLDKTQFVSGFSNLNWELSFITKELSSRNFHGPPKSISGRQILSSICKYTL